VVIDFISIESMIVNPLTKDMSLKNFKNHLAQMSWFHDVTIFNFTLIKLW